METSKPLVAIATRTQKVTNQDAVAYVGDCESSLSAVVVADGLGSHYGVDVASRSAAESLAIGLAAVESGLTLDLPALFQAARTAIEREVGLLRDTLPDAVSLSDAFGTTLLCGVDLPDCLKIAYVGNGAALHLRADFDEFPDTAVVPWAIVNVLNPHSRMQNGSNVLYKWLGPCTSIRQSEPTIVQITKGSDLRGDILVVCSDGICSLDQTPIGLDAEHQPWMRVERSTPLLIRHLQQFIADGVVTSAALRARLEDYLAALEAEGQMADDCSIGVIISSAARVRYEAKALARMAEQ